MTATRLIAAALAAGTLFTAPLAAAPAPEGSRLVRTADLDLATADGASTLRHRVAIAARNLCAAHGVRDLASLREAEACRTTALASADRQVEVALAAARSDRAFAANTVKAPLKGF